MKSFQQKRGLGDILHSRPVLVFLGVLVFAFAWGMIGFLGKMQTTRENRKIAENKVARLESQKKEFSAEIASLKTINGVEESIREKFPVAKEGEGMIIIVDDKNTMEVTPQKTGGFFSFLKNFFMIQ